MHRRILSLFAVTAAALLAVSASWAASTNDPVVQQRMENQERRIDKGVDSGNLTPRETGRLEAEQAKIKQDEARMKSDGKLTRRERAKLHREQDRANRDIYRLKHNNRTAN